MALMKCPECGREVSDKAKTCPHCGFPFEDLHEPLHKPPIVREIEEGATAVCFGGYEWRVLQHDKVNHRALVITANCIALREFHVSHISIDWKHCSLREWLNTEFFQMLPPVAKNRVVAIRCPYPDRSDLSDGQATSDRVFLLSTNEVTRYFTSMSDRIAHYQGEGMWWWLRSRGDDSRRAALVFGDGWVSDCGDFVDLAYGVRPALWLNLSS